MADSLESLESELLRLAIRESLRSPPLPSTSVVPVANTASAAEATYLCPEAVAESSAEPPVNAPEAAGESSLSSTSTSDLVAPEPSQSFANSATSSGQSRGLPSRHGPLGFLKDLNPVNLMLSLHESDDVNSVSLVGSTAPDTTATAQQEESQCCTPFETAAASAQSTPFEEPGNVPSISPVVLEGSPIIDVQSHSDQTAAATNAVEIQSQ